MRWLARLIFKRALQAPKGAPATDPARTPVLTRVGSVAIHIHAPTPGQVRADIERAVRHGGWDWTEGNR